MSDVAYIRGYMNNRRFGGNRETVIQRDGEQCVKCGTTRDEYQERFGFDLAVDHIDRDNTNHSLSNLQTLCQSCHSKKDSNHLKNVGHRFTKICTHCNKEFLSKRQRPKFCSRDCYEDCKRIIKTCQQCSTEFVSPTQFRRFCGKSCATTFQHKFAKPNKPCK